MNSDNRRLREIQQEKKVWQDQLNKCESISECFAFQGKLDILEKELEPGVFWTFKKSESRSDFEQDLKNFYKYIFNNILNNINYYYINIFKLKYN